MVTLILEVVFRAFTYGVHATFITLLFPSENFGFLYGVSFLIGGLTGFLAIPLFDMSMGTLSGINSKPLVNQDVHSAYSQGKTDVNHTRKSVTYPELCKRQFRCNKRLFLGVTWRQEPYSNYFHFADL